MMSVIFCRGMPCPVTYPVEGWEECSPHRHICRVHKQSLGKIVSP